MTSPLVTTTWLDQNLEEKHLRVIDIRGRVLPATEPPPHYHSHYEAYRESHIPGALFVDWVRDITVKGPEQMQIAPPERFAELMSRLGINEKTFVVAYDDAGGMFAARLWWALRYYGHERVAVLDGGWDKWNAEDRAITDEIPYVKATTFTPRINPALRRTGDDVLNALNNNTRLLDVRSEGEFRGEASRARRLGHIPGAINLPRKLLVAADETLRPGDVLEDVFDSLGIREGDEIVIYCNAGVSASYALLALRAAGIDGAVYDGSWKEWGNDDRFPVEK